MSDAGCVSRWLAISLLGLLMACGGGGGEGGSSIPGAYWTGIDLGTSGCGASVNEAVRGDVTFPASNRIRLLINVGAEPGCPAASFFIEGTQTGPDTWDMDDLTGAYVCALDAEYDYQMFDLDHGTIQRLGADYELDCDLSIESGGTVCAGWFHVYMQPD